MISVVFGWTTVGGTFDALLSHGRRVLAEWKTSNALYPEHLVQVRAYGALWEEALGLEMQDIDLPELGVHVMIAVLSGWVTAVKFTSATCGGGDGVPDVRVTDVAFPACRLLLAS